MDLDKVLVAIRGLLKVLILIVIVVVEVPNSGLVSCDHVDDGNSTIFQNQNEKFEWNTIWNNNNIPFSSSFLPQGLWACVICLINNFNLNIFIQFIVLLGFGINALIPFLYNNKWTGKLELGRNAEVIYFSILNNVLEILQLQHQMSKTDSTGLVVPFMPVLVLKFKLVPPKMDKRKWNQLWDQFESFVSRNDFAIRDQVLTLFGEEHRVWSWIPRPTSTTNRVEIASGDAKITSNSGPLTSLGSNSNGGGDNANGQEEVKILTNCLKVRQMIKLDSSLVLSDDLKLELEQVILGKCGSEASILHIGFGNSFGEWIVYIRCGSKEDTRKACKALYTWAYEEDRYFARFPEAQTQNTRRTYLGHDPNLSKASATN